MPDQDEVISKPKMTTTVSHARGKDSELVSMRLYVVELLCYTSNMWYVIRCTYLQK